MEVNFTLVFFIYIFFFDFYFLCRGDLSACVSVYYVCSAHGDKKKVLDHWSYILLWGNMGARI